tara:strand:- start:1528 stop:1806 length:279 start_codon:yes stop_codon:yes gene_type:complete
VLQSHHFRSGEELETTLHGYVWLYNQQLPQSAPRSKTLLQAMKEWNKDKLNLLKKQPYYLTQGNSYVFILGSFELKILIQHGIMPKREDFCQ